MTAASDAARAKRKGITPAQIDAARAKAAVLLAGGNPCPPPVMQDRASIFMPRFHRRAPDLAVRSKAGTPIGRR